MQIFLRVQFRGLGRGQKCAYAAGRNDLAARSQYPS